MQSSKEKEQTFHKFKSFFRMTSKQGGSRDRHEFILTQELERELRPETPVAQRCKCLKDLGEIVANNPLAENLVPKLWDLTKDLIVPNKPAEQRQIALVFYCKLIQGQYKDLGMMRGHFFHVIQDHDVPEDLPYRLDLLKALTDNGKEIGHFEEKIGRFMLEWVAPIVEEKLTKGFLEMLINIIRYNTAYLDKDIIIGILHNACTLSCTIDDPNTVLHCLSVLDTVIRYAIFPDEALPLVIMALCRTVNSESYCQTAWQIMRNLLGTDLGHAALLQMCNILNEQALHNDAALLRGAVFHINMGVWGSSSSAASTLRCTPSMVLLSFLHSLKSGHMIVTYETTLSIQRLIQNQGKELSEPTWDVIIDILFAIAKNNADSNLSKDNVIQRHFHDTLDMIEDLIGSIAADPEKIYSLIEHVCQDRSVSKANIYGFGKLRLDWRDSSSVRSILVTVDDPDAFILQWLLKF